MRLSVCLSSSSGLEGFVLTPLRFTARQHFTIELTLEIELETIEIGIGSLQAIKY